MEERQVRKQPKGSDSFVNPRPLFEIEIDPIGMGTDVKPPYSRYGVVSIDNFTEKGVGFSYNEQKPWKADRRNTGSDKQHTGKPEHIYSDQEGAFQSPEWVRFINSPNLNHLTFISGAHIVERFNRTL